VADKPRLLDLFCGGGGAAMGYALAGFEVVGVDNRPQPHYPFEFHLADALTFPLAGFDAYHASPPCQKFSSMSRLTNHEHPDLIPPTRQRLRATGRPYVIENVEGAPLLEPWLLCGTMFGLEVRRHRLFEVNFPLTLTSPCNCLRGNREGRLIAFRSGKPAPGRRRPPRDVESEYRTAMGVPWLPVKVARQAIPPAYTEWVGSCLRVELRG
jgi:hypothetical protein